MFYSFTKIKFKLVLYSLLFLLVSNTHAQIEFYYGQPEERYEISQETSQIILDAFLKTHKATTIEFNPNPNSSYPFRLKNKKGNWVLFVDDWSGNNSIFMPKKGKQYSFQFPTKLQESIKMTLAIRKTKPIGSTLKTKQLKAK
jgi:hypothetical protein